VQEGEEEEEILKFGYGEKEGGSRWVKSTTTTDSIPDAQKSQHHGSHYSTTTTQTPISTSSIPARIVADLPPLRVRYTHPQN
jgi:hypothetical protein